MTSNRPYKSVRALSRGLAVLRALNRVGSARPAQLAQAVGIDRTTAYRLIATLEDAGLVRVSGDNGEYVLTEQVRSLSDGFTARDRMTQAVTPHLGVLFQKVLWPTDFATFEGGAMIIRETTHPFSPYSVHRAMVGRSRPLLGSALGRAALAGASAEDRSTMIEIMLGREGGVQMRADIVDEQVRSLLVDYARLGYAFSVGGTEGNISAIAVPVAVGSGVAAAVNLVFFSSAMSVELAAERFLEPLKQCAIDIEASLGR